MIEYSLICDAGHKFNSWFPSSESYEEQRANGLAICPYCGSPNLTKAPMAPAVVGGKRRASRVMEEVSEAATEAPADVPHEARMEAGQERLPVTMPTAAQHKKVLALMREMRKTVLEKADYVGDQFAEEARKIHYGEADPRGIYGDTSADDAAALIDEGIDIYPLPLLPEDHH